MLGSDCKSTIGMVAKGRHKLRQHANNTAQNEHALRDIRDGANFLLQELNRTENKLCAVHRIATFLDPRFRGTFQRTQQ